MALHVDYCLDMDQLPADCIADCSRPGSVDEAVSHWREALGFTVDRDRALRCLKGYGAWDDLAEDSDEVLAERVLWLACGDFSEFQTWRERNPGRPPEEANTGSTVFCLE